MGATQALQPVKLSLFDIEQGLMALLDTSDMVPEEQQARYAAVVQADLATAVNKRQRVGEFSLFLKERKAAYQSEIKRLQTGLKAIETTEKKVSDNAVFVMVSLGQDENGNLLTRRLQGHNLALCADKDPRSVCIVNEDAVPDDYKTYTAKFPMSAWRALVDLVKNNSLDALIDPDAARLIQIAVEQATENGEVSISKSAIKQALDDKRDIPGATYNPPSYRLAVR